MFFKEVNLRVLFNLFLAFAGLFIFLYLLYVSNVFAAIVWFVNLVMLVLLLETAGKYSSKFEWFLIIQVYGLGIGMFFFSYSQVMLAYYLFLFFSGFILFLEYPLESLCKNS